MINFHSPRIYSAKEVATVFQTISEYINAHPFAMQTERVFRISGESTHSKKIIEDILKNNRFENNQYSVHDYIGALKLTLINSHLLNSDERELDILREAVSSNDLTLGSRAINQFIKSLAASNDPNKFYVAQTLYNYLHMATHALFFQQKNKMNSKNLGIVIGPIFVNFLSNNIKEMLPLMGYFNEICLNLLESNDYANSFEQVFSHEIHTMRQKRLEELELELKVMERLRDTYADKLDNFNQQLKMDKEKLAQMKGKIYKGKHAEKAFLKYSISQKQQAINMLKSDDRKYNLVKINEISLEIDQLKEKLSQHKPKRPLIFSLKKRSEPNSLVRTKTRKNLLQLADEKQKRLFVLHHGKR